MSTNNPFSAFGFAADDATVDTLRADLAFALRKYIEQGKYSQKKAAELLGLTQNIVSHIVRGDIRHLSVERLVRAMVRAGIPGFAEWSGSAEDARAGSGYRISETYVVSRPIRLSNPNATVWNATSQFSSVGSSGPSGTPGLGRYHPDNKGTN